jgi:hypothetical protein
VRELCLLSWVRIVKVGLEREPCLLREVFLVICSEMARREEGLKNVGAPPSTKSRKI